MCLLWFVVYVVVVVVVVAEVEVVVVVSCHGGWVVTERGSY